MAYISRDNNTVVVDAILTKKGRELLANGQTAFNIVKFALADDEVDYSLWNPHNAKGSNYYGEVIENMPLMEANVNETKSMRYKLVTLNKDQTRVAVLKDLPEIITLESQVGQYTLNPNTLPTGADSTLGYTLVLHDSSLATIETIGNVPTGGESQAASFINIQDYSTTITALGKSFKLRAKSTLEFKTTQITIIGNETGATATITLRIRPIQVLADGSVSSNM